MYPALLIVDDDEDIRSQMKWALARDYEVAVAGDRSSALEAFETQRPAVVLLDLGLPPTPAGPEEGFATLAGLLALDRHLKVIIISGQAEKANTLKAVGEGAYDFLSKPVDMEELRLILRRASHLAALEREYADLQRRAGGDAFEGMLGTSPLMLEVFSRVRKVATTDASVLILGESGTGKEMVAQAIHQRSTRRDQPFVAINCSAIPETLLESELFGHEKGSFTGAHMQRKGRIEMASSGTLFLDEIGELPLPIQVKLLRFLQDQFIERVGGRSPIKVDTRVVAATNVDLKAGMQTGRFREDLFYRLAVVVLELPALRKREGDIPLLAKAFLQRFSGVSRKAPSFTKDAVTAMFRHSWPGNVRELENRVKRAVIMSEGGRLTAADLELEDALTGRPGRSLREAREALEREMVEQALRRHSDNVSAAAADLDISRPTLYDLMEKLRLKKE